MEQVQCQSPLSEKDLNYLKDHLSWELLAAKKAFQYAHQSQDNTVKDLLFEVSQQHQRNYEKLLAHLGGHAHATIQAMSGQSSMMQ